MTLSDWRVLHQILIEFNLLSLLLNLIVVVVDDGVLSLVWLQGVC